MAYRNPQRYVSFADLAVELITDKNRPLAVLKELKQTVDWSPITINQLLEQFFARSNGCHLSKINPDIMPRCPKYIDRYLIRPSALN